MIPKEVVKEKVQRSNAGNAEAIAELYSEDAINHQTPQEPVEDREVLRADFIIEFSRVDMT